MFYQVWDKIDFGVFFNTQSIFDGVLYALIPTLFDRVVIDIVKREVSQNISFVVTLFIELRVR
jgi:hypothetical protein